jgi:hypothetical protein
MGEACGKGQVERGPADEFFGVESLVSLVEIVDGSVDTVFAVIPRRQSSLLCPRSEATPTARTSACRCSPHIVEICADYRRCRFMSAKTRRY